MKYLFFLLFVCIIITFIYLKQYECFQNNNQNSNVCIKNKNISVNDNINRNKQALVKNGSSQWYDLKTQGYSYISPKYWNLPQTYEPLCNNINNNVPSPIISKGTPQNALFYKPS